MLLAIATPMERRDGGNAFIRRLNLEDYPMRMCTWILGAAMLAAPPVMALESAPQTPSQAEPAVNAPAVNVNAPRLTLSTEKLLALRNSLSARVAVYDAVDKAYRTPTPSEQAQFSQDIAAAGQPSVVTLSNGAIAMKAGASQLSFVTVVVQPDGTMTMGHVAEGEAASVATAGDHNAE